MAVLELAAFQQQQLRTVVHCAAGRSRSPTVVLLYWMARDGLTWRQAFDRLEKSRWSNLFSDGHPTLLDEATAARVIERTRALLAGDERVLAEWRDRAARFQHQLDQLGIVEAGPRPCRWKTITPHLALTEQLSDWPVWQKHATDLLLVVTLATTPPTGLPSTAICYCFPDGQATDWALVQQAIRQLVTAWRAGQRALVVWLDDDFVAVTILVAALVRHHGWDVSEAFWVVHRRYERTIWYGRELWEQDWPALLAADAARFSGSDEQFRGQ